MRQDILGMFLKDPGMTEQARQLIRGVPDHEWMGVLPNGGLKVSGPKGTRTGGKGKAKGGKGGGKKGGGGGKKGKK